MSTRAALATAKLPLDKGDWEEAALATIAAAGVAALSVEGLARTLGVTKGSFYWHFADRAALLAGCLLRWERRYTDAVIEALEPISDAREKLRRLLSGINVAEEAWRVHVALSASTAEPLVAQALARVSKRRIAYVEACYRALGLARGEARHRALLAYAAYLGSLHLRLEGPRELPAGAGRARYLATMIEALVPAAGVRR